MRIVITVLICVLAGGLFGQSFQKKQQLSLAIDSIESMHWADMDNDSLLDVVVSHKDNKQLHISVFVNVGSDPWTMQTIASVPYVSGIKFSLTDVNEDSKVDLQMVSRTQVNLFLNQGNLVFANTSFASPYPQLNQVQFVDFNANTVPDTLVVTDTKVRIGNAFDSTLTVTDFLVFDFDRNGFKDLMASGRDANNQPITFAWYFGSRLNVLSRTLVARLDGRLAAGDSNHDGFFDVAISGKNAQNELKTWFLNYSNRQYVKADSTVGLTDAQMLIADFTSDGLTDVAFRGLDKNNQPQNWIKTAQADSVALFSNIVAQAFGDYDRDGDLDWGYVKNDSLYVASNAVVAINKGPGTAFDPFAAQLFNKSFIYWEKPLDDHTPKPSLTFDLKLSNVSGLLVGSQFDADSKHRITVSHGNTGTANYALLKLQGGFNFEIQSIDNAFVPDSLSHTRGNCSGTFAPGSGCNIQVEDIVTCSSAPVQLTAPSSNALWFTFSAGYASTGSEFDVNVSSADTVFSFDPSASFCDKLKLYTLKRNPTDTVRIEHEQTVCKDQNITLQVADGWQNPVWKNNRNATVVSAPSVTHQVKADILFTVRAVNDYACALKETFAITMSDPVIALNGTHFQIIRGSSVQLEASGAESYVWQPSASLNNATLSNPIASPEETTTFTVRATDSIGCAAQAQILVEVFEEAFIPTMFTPNGDSRNDLLKIYGLTQASGFRFVIFNREGTTLYETTSVSDVSQTGWSGSVNGVQQPPGTYYWKVEGRLANGELLLNGKKTGAFLLVR